jgi:D-sedoheptulose 7-phosphate isomerase
MTEIHYLESAEKYCADYFDDMGLVAASIDQSSQVDFARIVVETYQADRTMFAVGNGGSATTAAHLICDLSKTARPANGRALRSMALVEAALLTAYANDVEFSAVWAE